MKEYIKTNKIDILKKYDNNETIIYIDIDSTILTSKNPYYGSQEWSSYAIKKHGFLFGLTMWFNVLKKINVIPAEKTTEHVLHNIKNAKIVICTKRSQYLHNITLKHLSIINFDKMKNTYKTIDIPLGKYGRFKSGIMFCDMENKADCIKLLKNGLFKKYKSHVVIDDSHIDQYKRVSDLTVIEYTKISERKLDQSKFINMDKSKFEIFLSGKCGSGKDLAKDCFVEIFKNKKVLIIRFADKIKELCSNFTTTKLEVAYKNKGYVPSKFISKKDMITEIELFLNEVSIIDQSENIKLFVNYLKSLEGKVSIGKIQVIIGKEFRKLFSPNIWVDHQLLKLNKEDYDVAIVVDGRFKNEAKTFEKIGSSMIRLERKFELREKYLCGRNPNDISEIDLDNYQFQFAIQNNYKEKEKLFDILLKLVR